MFADTLTVQVKKLCVIVINYFGATHTEQCILALLGQSVDTLYVVDNSAVPDEADAIKAMVNRLRKAGIGFSIEEIFNQTNLGFSKAVNNVLLNDKQKGGHSYYLLLNNDVIVTEDALADLMHCMRSSPTNRLVSPQIYSQGQWAYEMYYSRFFGYTSYNASSLMVPFLTGTCLLVDARLIDKHGLLDEDFFMYGEDVLLSWKAGRAALQCATQVQVSHIGSASSVKGSPFYEFHVARGHVLLADKLSETLTEKYLFLFGRMGYLSLRAIARSLRFRRMIPIYALIRAWINRPPPIQAVSLISDREDESMGLK